MPTIIDPTSDLDTSQLTNIPGQSLFDTNTSEQLSSAGATLTNIPVEQTGPQDTFNTPTTPEDPTNYNAILKGLASSVESEETEVDKSQQDILDAMKELQGEEGFRQGQEEELGLPGQQKELLNLQNQLRTLNAEAVAQKEAVRNQPILSSIAVGQASELERTRAIKALGISAQMQAIQGNISLAEDQVQRAVDLKYKPLTQELELLNVQLDFNMANLSRQERKQAEALKVENDERLRQLKIQEAEEKTFQSVKINALVDGLSSNVADQAEALFSQGQVNEAYELISRSIPVKASGGGSEDGVKLSTTNQTKLLGAGFINDEIQQIESDVQQFGVESVLEGIADENQKRTIKDVYDVQEPEFLGIDYFKKLFTEDQLKASAKEAGFKAGGFLGFGVGQQGIDDYLNHLMNLVEQYRTAGFSDSEILKKMQ